MSKALIVTLQYLYPLVIVEISQNTQVSDIYIIIEKKKSLC